MDNAQNKLPLKFGLIGKNIDYSFSRSYFSDKFTKENLPHSYVNFDIQHISEVKDILKNNKSLGGLNVTIPYKEAIIPYLDKLDKRAKKIGAVNTIKRTKKGKLIGYNTDYFGFKKSLQNHITSYHKNGLILGTGGASKAIAYALKRLDINYHFVSRKQSDKVDYTYDNLSEDIIFKHQIIINCTPLGTFPNINECPNIPYDGITENHILFDLIYNPEETKFLRIGNIQRATTINGKKMLELQAEKAWDIWNS